MRINGAQYDTEERKIAFILSYMEGGSAGPWKESFQSNSFEIDSSTNQERGFGTFDDFIKTFNKAFSLISVKDTAIM